MSGISRLYFLTDGDRSSFLSVEQYQPKSVQEIRNKLLSSLFENLNRLHENKNIDFLFAIITVE